MTAQRERLIVFTRYPEPGRTKTRLIPALGPDGAADLQRRMTRHVLHQADGLAAETEIWYEGGGDARMRECFGADRAYRQQSPGDIGERMLAAFTDAFNSGASRVVLIGTDCPGISPALLRQALDALQRNDLVLGPAADGGYYLIGLKRPIPELFDGLPWSTGAVLEATLRICRDLGLKVELLDELRDVDRPEDLPDCERCLRATEPAISVVIPALNEAESIGRTLEQLGSGLDVVVSDGGSTDGTVEIARSHGVQVVTGPAGRGAQLNAGAAVATGEILLFLHADTILPGRWRDAVVETLDCDGVSAGAFAFHTDWDTPLMRLAEGYINWRSRTLQMPYGDQALFLRRTQFEAAGGFPDIPIMEDYELVRRLRKLGRIAIVPDPVTTSARRWQRHGVIRVTLRNKLNILACRLGVSPQRIARWYRGRGRLHHRRDSG